MSEVTDTLKELDKITSKLATIEAQREQLQDRAVTLIISALRAQVPPTEVADRSPYSAAHVRRLAREHNIPPAPPGPKARRRNVPDQP